MLEVAIWRYQNRSIETTQVIAQLSDLAKEMRAPHGRGEALGRAEDELAFYDALEVNAAAVKENARAKLWTIVKRLLRQHGYPPDKQENATQTVIEQAESLYEDRALV